MGTGITLFSFGHKYGMPEADVVLDARCLENPYWVPELRAGSGLDEPVRAYVLAQPAAEQYARACLELLMVQCRMAQGRGCELLRVAVGCTGGRHRSVALTEYLARELRAAGYVVAVSHRDILRG